MPTRADRVVKVGLNVTSAFARAALADDRELALLRSRRVKRAGRR